MFVLLKGPPGVGKSTIIKALQQRDALAFDLELLGETTCARIGAAISLVERYRDCEKSVYIGMADVSVEVFSGDIVSVLLLPGIDLYLERVRLRNEQFPHKKFQNEKEVYQRMMNNREAFDYIFTNEGSVEDIVEQVLVL